MLAHCVLCNSFLRIADVLAFRFQTFEPGKPNRIEPVDLDGREPWAGVRCVCKRCATVVHWACPVASPDSGMPID